MEYFVCLAQFSPFFLDHAGQGSSTGRIFDQLKLELVKYHTTGLPQKTARGGTFPARMAFHGFSFLLR
jgi:hypothetical protein